MLYHVYLMGYLLICLTSHLDLVLVHQNGEDWLWNDHDQKELLDADPIGSYDALSRSASDNLADIFPLLFIKPCSDNILMYGMQHIEDKYSAVIVTVVLVDDMTVYVFINGDKLSDSEFSWDLSHSNGILKYWSQLDNIYNV